MPDLFTSIKDFFLSLFTNSYFLTLLINVIVISISHYFAGRNTLAPNKIKIRQIQLDRVYLPLYRMLENFSANTPLQDVSVFCQKMTTLLDENYEFVFPQLHVLHKELILCIEQKENYGIKLMEIKHQISIEYDLLKKALGYPSESFFSILMRMTFSKRLEFLLGYLNIFWLISFVMFSLHNTMSSSEQPDAMSRIIFICLNTVMVLLNVIHIRTISKRGTK